MPSKTIVDQMRRSTGHTRSNPRERQRRMLKGLKVTLPAPAPDDCEPMFRYLLDVEGQHDVGWHDGGTAAHESEVAIVKFDQTGICIGH